VGCQQIDQRLPWRDHRRRTGAESVQDRRLHRLDQDQLRIAVVAVRVAAERVEAREVRVCVGRSPDEVIAAEVAHRRGAGDGEDPPVVGQPLPQARR
jgi:hypothetical protein